MVIKNVSEAKAQLSSLVEEVLRGNEVIIGRAGKPEIKLIKYSPELQERKPGALKGKIKIHEGFDILPPELAEAFGIVPPPKSTKSKNPKRK